MSYDPLEPDVRDRIRRLVGDASDDDEEEYFPDETYDRVIGQVTNWKRACAEMAMSVMVEIKADPDAMASDGDSMSWRDRIKGLEILVARMLKEADAEDEASAEVATAPAYAPVIAPVEWR